MPRIVLQVTHGPRWDHKSARWQHNGEQIVIEAESDAALLEQFAAHEAHCKAILEGEIPSAGVPKSLLRRAIERATAELKEAFSPSKEPTGAPSAASEESKGDPAASKDSKGKPKCPECGQVFKNERGLTVHLRNSGHGAPSESKE